jgi:hypothetical protein
VLDVPADYADPNHPHNGDIERQLPQPHKPFMNKRTISLIAILTAICLAAITAILGVHFSKTHAHAKHPAASSGIQSTATLLPTATQTATSKPTPTDSDPCLDNGIWPGRQLCLENCKGFDGYPLTHCEHQELDFWKCWQCPHVKAKPSPTTTVAFVAPIGDAPVTSLAPSSASISLNPSQSAPSPSERQGCMAGGHFSSYGQCMEHCKEFGDVGSFGCEGSGSTYQCWWCDV